MEGGCTTGGKATLVLVLHSLQPIRGNSMPLLGRSLGRTRARPPPRRFAARMGEPWGRRRAGAAQAGAAPRLSTGARAGQPAATECHGPGSTTGRAVRPVLRTALPGHLLCAEVPLDGKFDAQRRGASSKKSKTKKRKFQKDLRDEEMPKKEREPRGKTRAVPSSPSPFFSLRGPGEESAGSTPRRLPPTPRQEAPGVASRGRSGAERRQSILRPVAEGLGYAAVSAVGELLQTMANAVAPAPPPTLEPPPKPRSPSARFRSPGRDWQPKMDPSLQRHALLVGMSSQADFDLRRCRQEVSAMEEVSLESPSFFPGHALTTLTISYP